jgi:hypothetical protein
LCPWQIEVLLKGKSLAKKKRKILKGKGLVNKIFFPINKCLYIHIKVLLINKKLAKKKK